MAAMAVVNSCCRFASMLKWGVLYQGNIRPLNFLKKIRYYIHCLDAAYVEEGSERNCRGGGGAGSDAEGAGDGGTNMRQTP